MIEGIDVNTPEVVKQLQELDVPIYLTGSRFFGTYTYTSDWDFFIDGEDALKINKELNGMNFKTVRVDTYNDMCMVSLYQSGNVHLQVCKKGTAKVKYELQYLMKEKGFRPPINKQAAKEWWNMLLATALHFAVVE